MESVASRIELLEKLGEKSGREVWLGRLKEEADFENRYVIVSIQLKSETENKLF